MSSRVEFPTKKVHYVGSSAVVTIDQQHVRRLNLDDNSFFVQKPIPNGILLEKRVLKIEVHSENNKLENEGIKGNGLSDAEEKPEGILIHKQEI